MITSRDQPSAVLKATGSSEDILAFLKKQSRKKELNYFGLGYNLQEDSVKGWWPGDLQHLRPFFFFFFATESRITDSNQVEAIPVLDNPPSHPIHLMYAQEKVEERLSGYFRRAYGKDLIVFRAGGNRWPLYVGDRPSLKTNEHMYSVDYNDRLRSSTLPLEGQGDGMRSFAGRVRFPVPERQPSRPVR